MSDVYGNDVLDEATAAGGAAGGASSLASMLNPAAIAVQGISSAIGGITSYFSGQQEAKQAQLAAQQARTVGGINTQEALLHGQAATARGATLAAASGGGLGGTTAGVLNQIAERGMFNARVAAYHGATQADADEFMAKVDKDNAINSLISGFTGAGFQAAAGSLKAGFRNQILQSPAYKAGEIGPYEVGQLT